ncbi:MAG: hypothetical protein HYZ42_10970 [Bacteroidetes bacterium]|nr:hypothetical protein [Bacteroidota bacterium]
MTEEQFLTYQKFNDKNAANYLIELLTANHIEFLFEDTSETYNHTFAFNEFNQEFRVKLQKQDFEKADKLQLEASAKQLNDVNKDYYLYEFTNDELIEVVAKSDEWGALDFLLAQEILKERGLEVNEIILARLRKHRLEELSQPAEHQRRFIIRGYIFSFLGGIVGVLIGWHLFSHKKTLPNGDRVFGYSAKDRKHGDRIFFIGIFFIIFWIAMRIIWR